MIILEIRAAEGGADARGLIYEQLAIYIRYCGLKGLKLETIEERSGAVIAEVSGRNAAEFFEGEAGGHRFQRVPPTERHGRRHTSTVTVAVLPVPERGASAIADSEIEWQATRGSGPGGQHRNKTASAVQMRHVPSGIVVRVESERSQHVNREAAYRLLSARLAAREASTRAESRAGERRRQIGSGERGDKIRTVRLQDGVVTDHRTGRRTTTTRYLRGHVDDLR